MLHVFSHYNLSDTTMTDVEKELERWEVGLQFLSKALLENAQEILSNTTTTNNKKELEQLQTEMEFLSKAMLEKAQDVPPLAQDVPLPAHKYTGSDAKTLLYKVIARRVLDALEDGLSFFWPDKKYYASIFGKEEVLGTIQCKMLLNEFAQNLTTFMHQNNCIDTDFTIVGLITESPIGLHELRVVLKWDHVFSQ